MTGGIHTSWTVLLKKILLLILLCGVIGCVVASNSTSIEVADPEQSICDEHCVDVGAVDDEAVIALVRSHICDEHCVDVGAPETGGDEDCPCSPFRALRQS